MERHGIACEIDDRDQAKRIGGGGVGDGDGELLWLAGRSDGTDGADDGAILVTAANSRKYGGEAERENGDACEAVGGEGDSLLAGACGATLRTNSTPRKRSL